MPHPVPTCFSPTYAADTPTASMRKLAPVAAAVSSAGHASLIDPGNFDPELLRGLHADAYLDGWLGGEEPHASAPGWRQTPAIRAGVLAMQAGQIKGAALAMEHGLAANVAQGFHHSRPERGGGFCTFNGLALVAHLNPKLRVAVLDCDEHEGNGTSEFSLILNNLRNATIFGSGFGGPKSPRALPLRVRLRGGDFTPYHNALDQAFRWLGQEPVDLLLYQAGVDCHEDDPLGSVGLSTRQLFDRDAFVFAEVKRRGWPCLFVLAGGYQEPIGEKLVPLHAQTFAAAAESGS